MNCPFWSNKREKIECYNECPMLINESGNVKDGEQCLFIECSSDNEFNLKDIIHKDYNYLKGYDDENSITISL